MKIRLKDFGPISHFEFDLEKDLHVIFGKNNIGKSYAITAVYLILKNLIDESDEYNSTLYLHKNKLNSSIINYEEEKIINEFKERNESSIDISEKIAKTFNSILHQFIQKLGNSLVNSFDSITQLSNKRSSELLTIELVYNDFAVTISCNEQLNALFVKDVKLNIPILLKITDSHEITDDYKEPLLANGNYIIYYNNEQNKINVFNIIEYFYQKFRTEVSDYIAQVYYLPASRSGLYMGLGSFNSIFAELSKNRHYLTQKIELQSIPEQVADYFLSLSNITNTTNNGFGNIVQTIEKNILKGNVLFNNETKKIVFRENGIDLELDLSHTSSMVSEIAPIVAYLKHIISRKDVSKDKRYGLIFIEEPEAHLHPEVQVKLMEIFTLLAGKNVKIVMTSHSNYMFNKLSNLVLDNKIDYNMVDSYLMRATDAGSVTDMLSMQVEVDGMNDDNFADVAEMLYEERIKIYNKLNKETKNVD